MKCKYKIVDVFENGFCSGNPVCVVFLEENNIPIERLQQLANWINLSETTFMYNTKESEYDLRIFTPDTELPFAGHPTLGSAWAFCESRAQQTKITQNCQYGKVLIQRVDNQMAFTLPYYTPKQVVSQNMITEYYALPTIGDAQIFDTGPIWIVCEVSDKQALEKINIGTEATVHWMKEMSAEGINLFFREKDNTIYIRTFFHANNQMIEDPACGSGNAAVAAYLLENARFPNTGYRALQGHARGRSAQVYLSVVDKKICVAGNCRTIMEGEVAL